MDNITIQDNDSNIILTPNIIEIEECIICYNHYIINDGVIFNCDHRVCIACYQNMINNIPNVTCPLCRRSIDNTNNTNNNTIIHYSINDIINNEIIINNLPLYQQICKCGFILIFVTSIIIIINIVVAVVK